MHMQFCSNARFPDQRSLTCNFFIFYYHTRSWNLKRLQTIKYIINYKDFNCCFSAILHLPSFHFLSLIDYIFIRVSILSFIIVPIHILYAAAGNKICAI